MEEGVPNLEKLPDGILQGKNMMRKHGYMGPSPPFGKHHYTFRIFALDTKFENQSVMNKKQLLKNIENHVLDKTELTGEYSKKE